MKATIDKFINERAIAVAGVSPRKGNWGLALMQELRKSGYTVYPINPGYPEIEGVKCFAGVRDLPADVSNLILAVNPDRAVEIIEETEGTGIRRVWLNQGIGNGAFSEKGLTLLRDKQMEYVYGFCPMMFFGKGFHKFHFWMRKNFGKVPAEFSMN